MGFLKTIKDGDFEDPTVWDLGRVPKDYDTLDVFHHVTCPPEMQKRIGLQIRLRSAAARFDVSKVKATEIVAQAAPSGVRMSSGGE